MPEASTDIIRVGRPEPGSLAEVDIRSGQTYALDFDPSEVLFEPHGADVVLTFEDGGRLELKGFIAASASGPVLLELPDGALIGGSDLVDSMSMSLQDFRTQGQASPVPDAASLSFFSSGSGVGPGEAMPFSVAPASPAAPALRLEDVLDCSAPLPLPVLPTSVYAPLLYGLEPCNDVSRYEVDCSARGWVAQDEAAFLFLVHWLS